MNEHQQALLARWQQLREELPASVSLLAVSKYAPDAAVELLIAAGQRQFGESRPQQLRDRAVRWPVCDWHMIGPLQKNKAKYVARAAAMWHSCDDLEIARAVAKHVVGRQLPVLVQINIGGVAGQRGIAPAQLHDFVGALDQLQTLRMAGLMCMAPRSGDDAVAEAFQQMRQLRDRLQSTRSATEQLLLCMGMSGDYRLAIEAGSEMVRIGSSLFGDWDVRCSSQEVLCNNCE